MRGDATRAVVAAAPRADLQHGGEANPSADRVHDHAAREIVEFGACVGLQPRLHAEMPVPRDALEEWIDERHERERRGDLRIEARTLGDAARHDGRNGGGEREQEEEAHELVAVALCQHRRTGEEARAVRDGVADEEIGDGRDGEVDQDLHQRVDLVLAPHGPELEEGEARMHREHHHGTEQDEQRVGAGLERFHRRSPGGCAARAASRACLADGCRRRAQDYGRECRVASRASGSTKSMPPAATPAGAACRGRCAIRAGARGVLGKPTRAARRAAAAAHPTGTSRA